MNNRIQTNKSISIFFAASAVVILIITALVLLHYNSGSSSLKKANLLLEAGDFLGARKLYARIIDKDPKNFSAHFGLGMSYCAETIFNTELGTAKSPDWFPAIYHITIAMNIEENDQAKKTLAILYFNLGTSLNKEGNPDGAMGSIEQAVVYDSTLLKALNLLGAMYHERGNLDQAVQYYKKALAVKPDYAMAYFNLGACAWAKQEYDQSAGYFQQAVSLDPENPHFKTWLEKARTQAGK